MALMSSMRNVSSRRAEDENVWVVLLGEVALNRFVRTIRVADENRQLATNHLVEPRPNFGWQPREPPGTG